VQKRMLGRTGLELSELGLGAMTFGGEGAAWKAIGALPQPAANELVAQALDAGVNWFDTADMYAAGESESMLAKALGARRKDVIIATKVGFPQGSGPRQGRLTRLHIHSAAEASLKRLGGDAIDLYFLHRFEPRTPLFEQLQALDDLVRQGKVRYVGVSNFAAWQMMKAGALAEARGFTRFECAQMNYNPLARELEREVVPFLEDQQVGLVIWSPLASGVLSGKFSRDGKAPADARRATFEIGPIDWPKAARVLDATASIAKAHDATQAQVALAWLLAKPVVTSVIVGAKRPAQLADNLAAANLKLTAAEVAKIDEASKLTPEYPGWYLEQFGRIDG
jgi:aryl-alcohol dehydrogenase-like predicted oxidoreductase